ncbi:autotransporter assembly complex protein TamA [Luteimonas sp. RIT-PG2_3]|jgi:translocation and assembly module TamA
MPASRIAPAIAALFLFSAGVAHAAKVQRVDIHGLDETMTNNVRVALSLVDAIDKEVTGRRMAYMLREAENEAREALEPFGYYDPTITVERARGEEALTVSITIVPGEPVRVRNADLAILGEGNGDRYLQQDLANFIPGRGSVFNHAEYEASKIRISRRLTERGYFDSDFSSRRVEVTRADKAADIDLVWNSGERYDMGPTTFEQSPKRIINDDLLEKLIYWEEGQYYHQGRIDRLRTSLGKLDYFGEIEIEPQVDQAVDKLVPVKVTLTPAKRSIYTAGIAYGTDSGPGIRLGVERRYVNQRGHKALAQLDYAQKRKTLTTQYRIPAFAWFDGWYTVSLQAYDEQTDYIDTRRLELVGSRSGQYSRNLNLVASLHVLRERWAYDIDADDEGRLLYRYATYTYPSLRAEYINVDDQIFPRRGISGSLMLRGGAEGVGSDASFAQVHARTSWFQGMGEKSRLIVRGEVGHTYTNELVSTPPSLRFYAGGDRSIRGYEWREVGPRLITLEEDADNPGEFRRVSSYALGAKNVVTASVEFEHYFLDSWGAAVFVDSGSAFDGTTPDWHTGVGVGVRWKSPVGPLRFDIGRGLDNPDSPFTIGLSIGAEY